MERKNIYKALAAFQQEVPIIHKGTQGYGYSYADLPAILEVITPLLEKHKLGFTQPLNGGSIETIIFHTPSGEELSSVVDIPQNVSLKGMNDFQVLGSAITYLRRYSLSSALGLVTDKDIDASGEQKPKESPSQEDSKEWLSERGFEYLMTKGTKEDIETAFSGRRMKKEYRTKLEERKNTL